MATRCKFVCAEVSKSKGWTPEHPFHYAAKFGVVIDGSEENKAFFASTPSGQIEVRTVAADTFEVGRHYYVDFTEVSE